MSTHVIYAQHLPESFATEFQTNWNRFGQALEALELSSGQRQTLQKITENDTLMRDLASVWTASEFVAEQMIRKPVLLLEFVESGDLQQPLDAGLLARELSQACAEADSEEALALALRRRRNREMVRIIWRDQLELADLQETTQALSDLADRCIDKALDWLYADSCKTLGTPVSTINGEQIPQRLVVLGMGKLGAQELNLSSDIDLIFAYEGKGETVGGARALDNQQFFTRVGQRLIHVLDAQGMEGFVFRVDMRLRPYGDSGALVLSFAAMSEYYQTQGRDWERYAWIKARAVAGDRDAGKRLLHELHPFIYRRYLDYSAIDALRAMKRLIEREELRRGYREDIKLGPGGIREIEFIAQVFQLIRGGRDSRLQRRELLKVLPELAAMDLLPEDATRQLVHAYRFLRRVEHRLQAVRDKQTQRLPDKEAEQLRLAQGMGFANWQAFSDELSLQRGNVRRQFAALIADPSQPQQPDDQWLPLWLQQLDEKDAIELLREQGFEAPNESFEKLRSLNQSRKVQALQQIGQQRLQAFMPVLLAHIAQAGKPSQTLNRLIGLVEAVLRRTAYLVLLAENPGAMAQLVRLCAASPWIAEELARYPVLLDELIDPRSLYHPADAEELIAELRQQLLRIESEDVEQQMECLRQFKRAHVLRVAASEVTGALPLMKVSDYLTYIAEAVLKQVLNLAWEHLRRKHGAPRDEDGADVAPADTPAFIIVGYGKLGGLELSYGSDLDLVFIHDTPAEQITAGPQAVENSVFFTRLVQRMVHMITTHTPSGQLYDIDMRLRPSGASGLLVSSLAAYAKYQTGQAWTWEHQALVRARVIAGSAKVAQRFGRLRREILAAPRDGARLVGEVVEMRQKIALAQGRSREAAQDEPEFDLKYDAGGIVDIEFIVQYAVLLWSQKHPELLEYTDNIRILDALEAAGLMSAQNAALLRDAYIAFRSAVHRLTIDQRPSRLSAEELLGDGYLAQRQGVEEIWRNMLGAEPRQ